MFSPLYIPQDYPATSPLPLYRRDLLMPNLHTQNSIYQDALENALSEVQGLGAEISHLREFLQVLEKRKNAVEEMCGAIHRLVEEEGDSRTDQASILNFPNGFVALTPEEVSLITGTATGNNPPS